MSADHEDDETTAGEAKRGIARASERERGERERGRKKGFLLTYGGLNAGPKCQPAQFWMMVGPHEEAHADGGEDHDDTSKREDDSQGELLTDVHPHLPDQIDGQAND